MRRRRDNMNINKEYITFRFIGVEGGDSYVGEVSYVVKRDFLGESQNELQSFVNSTISELQKINLKVKWHLVN